MIKVMFVCHGNICRSTMAEAIAKYIVRQKGLENKFIFESSATSREEIGNPPDFRTMKTLDKNGISSKEYLYGKKARQITKEEYKSWDYFILMDSNNMRNILRIFNSTDKVYKIFEFTSEENRDVKDPWYTGDFDTTYKELYEEIEKLINKLDNKAI